MIDEDAIIQCVDGDGKPYGVLFGSIREGTGAPRYLVRCHDGSVHRVVVHEERARLGIRGFSLYEYACITPRLTDEQWRKSFIASRGGAAFRSPRWKKVEPLGPG